MTVAIESRAGATNIYFGVTACYVLANLVLGGGTRSGFLGDVALQLLALPLLFASIASSNTHFWESKSRSFAIVLLAAIVLLPLTQLVPLPPEVWTKLRGREALASVFTLLDQEIPWHPISLVPRSGWLAFLSLIPVAAVFMATLQLNYQHRRLLCLIVVSFGLLCVFLGLVQLAQGPQSSLRFYEVTNTEDTVGFFANRNHFAALLYISLTYAAAWAIAAIGDLHGAAARKHFPTAMVLTTIVSLACIAVLSAAIVMSRSRAGLGLAIIALASAGLIGFRSRSAHDAAPLISRSLLIAALLALTFFVQFGLYRALQRFDSDPFADSRIPFARNTLEAALAVLPFGSGVGSFVPIYASFEKPADTYEAYANRAHNDFLEGFLETGLFGAAIFAAFLMWFVARAAAIFGKPEQFADQLDQLLARAAVLAITLVLAHSAVDYPLRTGAISALFAFSCALLLPPPASNPDASADPEFIGTPRGHRSAAKGGPRPSAQPSTRSGVDQPQTIPNEAPPSHLAAGTERRWGDDIVWPDAWNKEEVKPSVAPPRNQR